MQNYFDRGSIYIYLYTYILIYFAKERERIFLRHRGYFATDRVRDSFVYSLGVGI